MENYTRGVEDQLADQLLGLGDLEPPTPGSHHDRVQELIQTARHPGNGNHLAHTADAAAATRRVRYDCSQSRSRRKCNDLIWARLLPTRSPSQIKTSSA